MYDQLLKLKIVNSLSNVMAVAVTIEVTVILFNANGGCCNSVSAVD